MQINTATKADPTFARNSISAAIARKTAGLELEYISSGPGGVIVGCFRHTNSGPTDSDERWTRPSVRRASEQSYLCGRLAPSVLSSVFIPFLYPSEKTHWERQSVSSAQIRLAQSGLGIYNSTASTRCVQL